jgi:hypothetical protein
VVGPVLLQEERIARAAIGWPADGAATRPACPPEGAGMPGARLGVPQPRWHPASAIEHGQELAQGPDHGGRERALHGPRPRRAAPGWTRW